MEISREFSVKITRFLMFISKDSSTKKDKFKKALMLIKLKTFVSLFNPKNNFYKDIG